MKQENNLQSPKVLEDLEEVDSLEVFDEAEENKEKEINIFDLHCVKNWMAHYTSISCATLIMDSRFTIRWKNKHFSRLFEKEENYLSNSFFKLFSHSNLLPEIYKGLKSHQTNYFWHGRLEIRYHAYPHIISSVSVFPFFGENKTPLAYWAIFDDQTALSDRLLRGPFLSLLQASKLKDNDTGNHIERVNQYSKVISEALFGKKEYPQISRDFIEDISFLAAMHDVGKIGTPDDILNKKGKLETWEWDVMKEHTINGAYILSSYPNPMAKEITLSHHEHWNGKGYPYGLKEKMIPLSARIVSIADVYDALRMKRSYKPAFEHEKALKLISHGRGIQFDPDLVDICLDIAEKFKQIFESLQDAPPALGMSSPANKGSSSQSPGKGAKSI